MRVKTIYKERALEEKDGARLMQSAFSPNNPIIKIGDISTETGRDIQQGYMEMFSGAMKGIRNPKLCYHYIAKEFYIHSSFFW